MSRRNAYPTRLLGVVLALSGATFPTWAQQRPDSGTLQPQQPQLPELPALGDPGLKTPAPRRAFLGTKEAVKPAGFRFIGNTVLSDAELLEVVARFVGKDSNTDEIVEAAELLRKFYVERGYPLTDVYLPAQTFSREGGVIEFGVVEARVGKVKVTGDAGVSQGFGQQLADQYLPRGALISRASLEKAILLLRDQPGTNAEASISPGGQPGEADIAIVLKSSGVGFETSATLDNHGALSSGALRAGVDLVVNTPLQMGDVLSARLQTSQRSGNTLGRLAYRLSAGSFGTRLNFSYTQNEYTLGEQFATLGAFGKSEVLGLGLVQPLIRGRETNLFLSAGYDDKILKDTISQSGSNAKKTVGLVRFGLLGNNADTLGTGGGEPSRFTGGTTSFAATLSVGRLSLDAESLKLDIGDATAFGARTAGRFAKLNVEFQRAQYFSESISLLLNVSGQLASKNLTSAEKFALGGPQGVRGYPVGEGIGDDGVLANIEFRYRTPFELLKEAVTVIVFYDYGQVKRDHVRSDTVLNKSAAANNVTLDSIGVGAQIGKEGRFIGSLGLATRVSNILPSTGDPDARPRLWASVQYWF